MIKKIRDMVLSYYKKNDGAHQIEHADEVYQNFLDIDKKLNTKFNKDMMIVIAYCHDMFSTIEYRKIHEIKASEWVLENKELFNFNEDEIKIVACAIREHRASYKGEFCSMYSKCMNAADKGVLLLNDTLKRSYKYHLDRGDKEYAIKEVFDHMKDKFGSTGYYQPDEFYLECYNDSYKKFTKDVDELTFDYVKEYLTK